MAAQLPVLSPVSLAWLLGGMRSMLDGGVAAQHRVRALVAAEYQPLDSLLLDSGTSALTQGLIGAGEYVRAAGREPIVALPAYGCFDLATAAVAAGTRVLPYDIAPATLGPEWGSLSAALARGASVIVLAHWYGVPVDVVRAGELASRHGALLIDDAAQGVGAAIGDRPVGSFGDLGVLSFGRGKGRTGGGGGALLANSGVGQAVLDRMRERVGPAASGLRQAVALKAQWVFGRPSLYWIPASLPFVRLGHTAWRSPAPVRGMSAFSAGALADAWADSGAEVGHRRASAAAWRRTHPDWDYPEPEVSGTRRGELRLPVVMADDAARRSALMAISGAMPGYPQVLPRLTPLAPMLLELGGSYPGAELLVQRLLTLPCHRYVHLPG